MWLLEERLLRRLLAAGVGPQVRAGACFFPGGLSLINSQFRKSVNALNSTATEDFKFMADFVAKMTAF